MAYSQPQENVTVTWLPDGRAQLVLTYQGREWHRQVGPRDLVTVIEAAALLGVSRSAPYQWVDAGRIRWQKARLAEDHREVVAFRLGDVRRFGLENGFLPLR